MKKLFVLLFSGICITLSAQNYSATQNQQNININLPVIEKKVYVEKYRTVYLDKPRVAKKLSAPVCLMGYLWVYPEDLGDFKQQPHNIITNINRMKSHGRSDWRIPTPDELAVLEANADLVGLGDGIYMADSHSNGNLRLVASDLKEELVVSNNKVTYYISLKDVGADYIGGKGKLFKMTDLARNPCPAGWHPMDNVDYWVIKSKGNLNVNIDDLYLNNADYLYGYVKVYASTYCDLRAGFFYGPEFSRRSAVRIRMDYDPDNIDCEYYENGEVVCFDRVSGYVDKFEELEEKTGYVRCVKSEYK